MRRLALALVLLAACGDDDGPSKQDVAIQGCEDVTQEFETICIRCQFQPAAVDCTPWAANIIGNCGFVQDLRDRDELYDQCLPWLRSLTCEQASSDSFVLDSSCKGQLLK